MFASLPLTALRAFESASRLLSFKAAAEELSVTPTAVSHQIRSLENWLGVPLFERLPRQVRLTECGERLFRSLHGALLEVAQSVDTLRPQRSGTSLTHDRCRCRPTWHSAMNWWGSCSAMICW